MYTGTVLLVLTMLLKKSIYQWALAYTAQEVQAADYARNFITSLVSMDCTFYTLVLAVVHGPAALVLQRQAQLLADSAVGEAEAE